MITRYTETETEGEEEKERERERERERENQALETLKPTQNNTMTIITDNNTYMLINKK